MRAAIIPNTREATEEVVSEDEDIMVPFEALDNRKESLSKGSSLKRYSFSLSLQNTNKKTKTACSALTVLSPKKQDKERLCCIFPGSMLEIKPTIDRIFREEVSTFMKNKEMKKVFENINLCAIVKNKLSIKNLVVKTKI